MRMGFICNRCDGVFESVQQCTEHEKSCNGRKTDVPLEKEEQPKNSERSVECPKCKKVLSVRDLLSKAVPDSECRPILYSRGNPADTPIEVYYIARCQHCSAQIPISLICTPSSLMVRDWYGKILCQGKVAKKSM